MGDHRGRAAALVRLVDVLSDRPSAARAPARDRGLIDSVAWLLSSLSEPKELAQRAMKMAVDAMDAERGVLLQIDQESDRLIPIAEHGALDPSTRQEALGYSRRVVQRVTESGVGMVLGDAVSDPSLRSESVVNLNLRSIVCVPMHVGGRTIGAVYLDDSRRPEAFSDEDRSLLEGFAQLMAIAIDRSRGHAEVLETNERLVGENLSLRQEVGARYQSGNVLGSSSQMRKVLATVEQAAQVNSTVMITGEMGTGKELIARTLHHTGKRKLRPFVAMNCGAIPENLIASELFGILPNVATDVHARPGRFVEADGGTLFLDEVGEMPLSQQVALLSVLANREVTPVGGGKAIPVDVRVISASNRDLREQVEKGEFRPDLFYRLNVIQIDIPPLRDRKADIPLLAHHFLAQFAEEQGRTAPELSPEFMAALMQSDWKGNVRELQNYIERILAMTPGLTLYPDPPPRDLEERAGTVQLKGRRPLPEMVEELEKRMVREALERANGNQSRAARDLGITEQSIRYRMKKFGLDTVRRNRRAR